MERRHLRYLIALAEEGGFTRAAERVGIAQPPLSKQIKDLEAEVGVQLVRRTPRGATLTPAGEILVERARSIEQSFAAAAAEARRVGLGQEGRLRVGFTESSIFHPRVAEALLAFRARFPAVDLVLEEALSTDLIATLEAGRLDAAFVRPPLPASLDWASRAVADEPMIVALPTGHALATRASLTLADLASETFVLFHRRVRPGMTDSILSACERAGFAPRSTQVPKITSALRLVAVGAGITVVPASLANVAMTGIVFRPLDEPSLVASILLLWRRDRSSPTLAHLSALATNPTATGTRR